MVKVNLVFNYLGKPCLLIKVLSGYFGEGEKQSGNAIQTEDNNCSHSHFCDLCGGDERHLPVKSALKALIWSPIKIVFCSSCTAYDTVEDIMIW